MNNKNGAVPDGIGFDAQALRLCFLMLTFLFRQSFPYGKKGKILIEFISQLAEFPDCFLRSFDTDLTTESHDPSKEGRT